MAKDQNHARSVIALSLGDDSINLEWVQVVQKLGEPFVIEALVLSAYGDIDFLPHLGKPAKIALNSRDGNATFHGYLFDISAVDDGHDGNHYRLSIRPWLYLLEKGLNFRIFQNMSVLEIIESVLTDADLNYIDFDKLRETYNKREYCTQYRESDAAFICRLMEEEGIYYYFRHEDDRHVLVLCDGPSSHSPIAPDEVVRFVPSAESIHLFHGCIWNWTEHVSSHSQAKVTLREFDFTRPAQPIEALDKREGQHPLDAIEVYDFPVRYIDGTDGERLSQVMLDSLRRERCVYAGETTLGSIASGQTFKLSDHPTDRFNQSYLITEVRQRSDRETFISGGGGDPSPKISFVAIPAETVWRIPFRTPKPVVRGPETAIVTGPPGEEIFTDKYGRVKVRFHWDRSKTKDEDSSCWIRVSHPWAGAGFGGIQIPRIGQEVIVDFLSGDPDRPIITGRVYNAERMPPHGLPAAANKSGMKSNTVKGQGSNELTFDDTAGKEMVYFHAQFDSKGVIEHDETQDVGNNRTRTVAVNETLTVGSDRSRTVGANEKISVASNRTRDVGANESVSIASNQTINIGATQAVTAGADATLTVGMNRTVEAGMNYELTAGMNVDVTAGIKVNVVAGVSITLTAGPSSIKLDPTGVTIMAPMIKLN